MRLTRTTVGAVCLGLLGALAPGVFAAGAKTGGIYTVVDDITGGSTGSVDLSGAGGYLVSQSLGQTAVQPTDPGLAAAFPGFFSFLTTQPGIPGCVAEKTVRKVGPGPNVYPTINLALSAVPASLTQDTCVVIRDTATYNEQVTVVNIANNNFRLGILGNPAMVSAPVISSTQAVAGYNGGSPPGPGFWINNASVTLQNLTIRPSAAGAPSSCTLNLTCPQYGVLTSSPNVVMTSVTVDDSSAQTILVAGVQVDSYTAINFSTITMRYAHNLVMAGSGNSVYYSSMTQTVFGSAGVQYGIWFNGSSSNTVTGSFILRKDGIGVNVLNASSNTISDSFIGSNTNSGGDNGTNGARAVLFDGASSNTITRSLIVNPSGTGVHLRNASNFNTVSLSAINAGGTPYKAFYLYNGPSFNVLTRNMISSPAGDGLFLEAGSNSNSISFSTIIGNNAAGQGLGIEGSSTNTITQCDISNPPGRVVALGPTAFFASSTTINASTMSANSASLAALFLDRASTTLVTQSFLSNPSGGAVNATARAVNTTLSRDRVTASGAAALSFNGSKTTLVSLSTVTASGAAAVNLSGTSSATLSASYIEGFSGLDLAGSTQTTVMGSVLFAAGSGGYGLWAHGGSSNLTVSTNMIAGRMGGANRGIFIDTGNYGQVLIASNTVRPVFQRGVFVQGPQNAGTSVEISSNAVFPLADQTQDTAGIAVDSLATGATIQNNSVYANPGGSVGGFTLTGIAAGASSGISIHHNRVSAPQTVTGAGLVGIAITDSPGTLVKFNDVYAAGSGLGAVYGVKAAGVDSGSRIEDNIVSMNVASAGTVAGLNIDPLAGVVSNYNDLWAPGAASGVGLYGSNPCQTLSCWQTLAGLDANSISVDPLWKDVTAGAEDFHPKSIAGRFYPPAQGFVMIDLATSQTIDAGAPAELSGNEPAPNGIPPAGAAVNLGSYGDTAEASKTFVQLQILLPGEYAAPYTPTLKGGTPSLAASHYYAVTVRITDQRGIIPAAANADVVSLTDNPNPLMLVSAPPNQTLVSGSTVFNGLSFTAHSGAGALSANDITNPTLTTAESSFAPVYGVNPLSSPTASFGILPNALVATFEGGLSGSAADPIAVFGLSLAIQKKSSGLYYDWNLPASTDNFKSAAPVYSTAALTPANGTGPSWTMRLPDSAFPNLTKYYARAVAINSSDNLGVAETTFTYNSFSLNGGTPGDGQGSAAVAASTGAGCQVLLSTVNFTAGSYGIDQDGFIALGVPEGWTKPIGVTTNSIAQPGFVYVKSTTAFSVDLNPPVEGKATLGDNWIVYKASAAVTPGQPITFGYMAFPSGKPVPFDSRTPSAPKVMGAQRFSVLTQGGPAGNLVAIASSPVLNLTAGSPTGISLWPAEPLTLTPLQVSPTMYLLLTDACGASTSNVTGSVIDVDLSAGFGGVADASATYTTAGVTLVPQRVPFALLDSITQPFNAATSKAGVYDEFFIAATAGGSPIGAASAQRFVSIVASITLSGVAVDNGTPGSGGATAALPADAFANPVFINFSMSNPNARWEVVISSSLTFDPEVVHRSGQGNPGRTLTWNGLNERLDPNQFLKPGTYYVKIIIEKGAKIDQSLSVTIPQSASIYGVIAATGTGAVVQAVGPGANYGNFSVGDPSGIFQIYGLTDGAVYNIEASTAVYFNGQFVRLGAKANNVAAANAGTNLGTMAFETPALLRVSAALPFIAPQEVYGGVSFHNADYSRAFFATLHFPAGTVKTDSGDQTFGVAAGTWSIIAVPPDTYTVALTFDQLGISTSIAGVALAAGGTTDLNVSLPKKANVYGWAVLPSTTPRGAFVSVQAALVGSTAAVSGGAYIPPPSAGVLPTSATYALYGLAPGVWNVTARAPGFASSVAAVSITSNADVGNPLSGGFDFALGLGGSLSGTVSVAGDSAELADAQPGTPGFTVFVNAYNPANFTHAAVPVRLSTHAVLASSTFTLSGLDDGTYYVGAHLDGASDASQVARVSAGSGTASLQLTRNNAEARLRITLPASAGSSDFSKVALMFSAPGVLAAVKQDMTAGSVVDISGSTAVWHSPPLGAGHVRFEALYGPTGQFRSVSAPLTAGATALLNLDLSQPAFPVSGSAFFTGNVTFTSAAYSVQVSSIAGIIAAAPTTSYCLMGQAQPVKVSNFHMELVPINPRTAGFLNGPLYPSPADGSCATAALPALGPEDPNPLLGYIASINANTGAFAFPGVAPGTYILRNGGAPELGAFRQLVAVGTAAVSVGTFKIDAGRSISGNLVAPSGCDPSRAATNLNRSFGVTLLDSQGKPLRSVPAAFNSFCAAPYVFDKLPNGDYAVTIQDRSFPPLYTARPLLVKLSGINQTSRDITLVRGGVIKGRLAVQQVLPNGATGQFLLVAQQSAALLPRNFQIKARANPWFQGGLNAARGQEGPTIDANDQFVIDSLLPGVYDVDFQSRNNPDDIAAGGVNLVSSFRPGVRVAEGRVTDLGLVKLTASLELRGRVVDSAGSPLANIGMEARPSSRGQATQDLLQARTDKNGAYVLSGLSPQIRYYDVFAGARGGVEGANTSLAPYEQKAAFSVDLSSFSVLDFSLTAAPYAVSGKVAVPSGGAPMILPLGQDAFRQQGALIFLQKEGVIASKNPLGDISAVTNPNGDFYITSLASGSYRMTFTSLNYGSVGRGVTIDASSVNIGTVTLALGALLSGSLRKADGSNPSQTDVKNIVAVTADLQNILFAALEKDANTKTYTGYKVSGFKVGPSTAPVSYKLLILGSRDILAPAEAQNIVFASTAPMTLDILYRAPKPSVLAKAKRKGANFAVQFETSHPLRSRTDDDNNLALIITTVAAKGTLSQYALSSDRTKLSALYEPGVGESTFTLALSGRSVIADPDSIDPVNPEFPLYSQATFYIGIDGLANTDISNLQGGNALIEGDAGRLTIPNGAFAVDASSSPTLTLQISSDTLSKVRTSGLFRTQEQANIAALRYAPAAYPEHLLRAMAATPPQVDPFSAFYDILLPLGVRTALAKPVALTVSYSTSTDPTTLNLYWYNAAANAYILQQDVTGAKPVIDTVNHTITVNVNHFSTFVLFNAGVNVITGDAFAGGDIEVYNFPNPFDLSVKTINTIHPVGAHTVRGTLVNISMPAGGASGAATLRIFTVIGERIRTIELGDLNAGTVYYQAWDGRNDSGHDVADGVYIGQVKLGSTSKFFKMAVIK